MNTIARLQYGTICDLVFVLAFGLLHLHAPANRGVQRQGCTLAVVTARSKSKPRF